MHMVHAVGRMLKSWSPACLDVVMHAGCFAFEDSSACDSFGNYFLCGVVGVFAAGVLRLSRAAESEDCIAGAAAGARAE